MSDLRLIYTSGGTVVPEGATLRDFRGSEWVFKYLSRAGNRIYVESPSGDDRREFYLDVFPGVKASTAAGDDVAVSS